MSTNFAEIYEGVKETVPFNPKWANGTGYYDHAVKGEEAPALQPGDIVKTMSEGDNRRRIVIIGTPMGNLVMFDRYTDGARGIVVKNAPEDLCKLVGGLSSNLSEDTIDHLVGGMWNAGNGFKNNNIGVRLKQTLDAWSHV